MVLIYQKNHLSSRKIFNCLCRQPSFRKKYLVDRGAASWLLQSVFHCEHEPDGASLRDIIAFGDFVNHAIFTFAEFSLAAGFLSAAGIIKQNGNRFRTRERFKDWCGQNIRAAVRPDYERERKLFAEYLMHVVPEKRPAAAAVSEQEFRAAVDAYLTDNQ